MAKRARRTQAVAVVVLETVARVWEKAEACRLADATGLPMTVFGTNDPDMRFVIKEFTRGGCFVAPPVVSSPYQSIPIVTFLPSNYFVGHRNWHLSPDDFHIVIF